MNNQYLFQFSIFLLYRLASVFIIQTFYVPDEYWQSLEVAHNMIFGYGYLTWEWRENLRSYIYPIIFATFYKLLKILKMDFLSFIILIPKLFQAVLTAVSDLYFILLCRYFNCDNYWAKTYLLTNWFWFYCGFRTLTNTFETSLTIIALYYFPWMLFIKKNKRSNLTDSNWSEIKKRSLVYMTLSAFACVIRPSAATTWGILFMFHLSYISINNLKKFVFSCILPVFLTIISCSFTVDFIWYGKITVPSYNFLLFNIIKDVSSFYGTHPFHWYITQGLPAVLGFQYLPFCFGLLSIYRNSFKQTHIHRKVFIIWFYVILLNVLILSNIPHKEFRFALPLVPLVSIFKMLLIAAKTSSEFFIPSKTKLKYAWTAILALGFLIPTMLFGVLHQRGSLELMHYLSKAASSCSSDCFFLFLMPCHSTPLYSYLHVNVSTRFLTCEPPLTHDHYDESEDFFGNPMAWLNSHWDNKNPPTHVAFFDSIENSVITFLKLKGFTKKCDFFHTIFAQENSGKYIVVYESS